ncbi:TPA: cell division protein DedD [Morganella morganii]|nr:cell division protein DedD [Morganella morganii]
MASKFQNRLVGTIILVAVGVIVLPVLLDGDKKYNEDQFAAIPLIPKEGEQDEIDAVNPINQTMPTMPSEGASSAMITEAAQTGTEEAPAEASAGGSTTSNVPPGADPLPPVVIPDKQPQPKPEPKPEKAPQGQAYVVQLGALSNARKVEEIVATLRLSGYQVYTVPRGKLTLIMVGPSASQAELKSSLGELRQLTGLDGRVQSYKP